MPNRCPPARYLVAVLCAILLPGVSARAQVIDSVSASRLGEWSGEIWAGYSPGSTTAGVLGRHGDIRLQLIGARWNRRIRASDSGFVYYTFDVIPMARVTPIVIYTTDAADRCNGPYYDCLRDTRIAHGIGFSPLGLTIITRANRMLQGRFGANGGMLLFDKPAPSDIAGRFNFTAAIEAGFQLVNAKGNGGLLVYRLHHISNAGTAEDNLAMLSHVVSLGFRWRFAR